MRYTGPKLRVLRRLNVKTLPGLTTKTIKELKRPKKQSLYALRLIEKQKLRYNFGINNHQFFRYVQRAQKMTGSTGDNLLKLLEMRFDTIVYRMKLAPTITSARQLITHGHFSINNRRVNSPNYQCQINDEISVCTQRKNLIRLWPSKSLKSQQPGASSPLLTSSSSDKPDDSKNSTRLSKSKNRKGSNISFAHDDHRLPMHLVLDEKRLVGKISNIISLQDPIIEKYYQQLELKPLYIIEFFSRKL